MTSPQDAKTTIAIPIADGKLCSHFGHCEQFVFFEVDLAKRQVTGSRRATPPPHEPGVLPRWLHGEGANMIIAGGMGRRAQDLFAHHGVHVLVGASASDPEEVVQNYLADKLTTAENPCDH